MYERERERESTYVHVCMYACVYVCIVEVLKTGMQKTWVSWIRSDVCVCVCVYECMYAKHIHACMHTGVTLCE